MRLALDRMSTELCRGDAMKKNLARMLCGIGKKSFGRQVDLQCRTKCVAVGEVNKAQTDEADKHIAGVQSLAKSAGFFSCLKDAGQMRENRVLRYRSLKLLEMPPFIEILPKQQPHKSGVRLQKQKVGRDRLLHRLKRILCCIVGGEKSSFNVLQLVIDRSENFSIERLLTPEIMVDHPLVSLRDGYDFINRNAVVAMFSK